MRNNDKKIVNISRKSADKRISAKKSKLKTFDGYDYVKMETDLNGLPFNRENLLEYAEDCKYMVRIMREKDKKIFLYNYCIPQDKLCEFLLKVQSGEVDGKIIEVEKFIPEDLA